ncbi:hypothetical protein CKO12_04870 [Chromatium okenii]|nr:hypothetical protein [Chromatium okenii]
MLMPRWCWLAWGLLALGSVSAAPPPVSAPAAADWRDWSLPPVPAAQEVPAEHEYRFRGDPRRQTLPHDPAGYHFRPLSESEQRRSPAVWRPLH